MKKSIALVVMACILIGSIYAVVLNKIGNAYSFEVRNSCETDIGYFDHGSEWIGTDGCSECYCQNGVVDCRSNNCSNLVN